MKILFTYLTTAVFIFILLQTNEVMAQMGSSSLPNYMPKFEFRNSNGEVKDTILPPFMFNLWCKSSDYPSYIQWVDQPFAIFKISTGGVGLFTDSAKGYSIGDTIGIAFYKKDVLSQLFGQSYAKSFITSFANDASDPTMNIVLSPAGLVFVARKNVTPLSELTFNSQQLIDLFPNDPTAKTAFRKLK